jgi:thioredoxin 1
MIELLDFYADWCPPCKITSPIIDELKKEYEGRVGIKKINVDQNPDEAAKFGVMGIPTFVLLKDGNEADRKTGAMSKEAFKVWIGGYL